MAAPTYSTDLITLIADNDTAAWGEYTNMTAGGAPDEIDTESALQGINAVSQITNTTALFSMGRVLTTSVSLTTGQVFLVWHGHGVATALLNYANGGLRLVVGGNSLNNWKAWAVGGVDVPPFPYGKWVNNPIDPTLTADYSNGTPPTGAANIFSVGSAGILSQAVAKGQPHVVDIIRYGRAEARFAGGEAGNYANFEGFAIVNDYNDSTNGYNRWGLLQVTTGGYLWKGLMVLGYNGLVNFVDSNKNIYVQDTRKVYAGFNRIEVRNTSSVVTWTSINMLATGSTSRGDFECIDNATVTKDGCTFTDMGTFKYLTNSTVTGSTYRRCQVVTTGGAIFTNNLFANSISTSSVISSSLNNIDTCTFISDGSNHAVELNSIGSGIMIWNNTTVGYASGVAASPVTPTSTGNETIYVNVASGTLTINVSDGASIPSIRSAGATVNVVAGLKLLSLTGIKNLTKVYLVNTDLPETDANFVIDTQLITPAGTYSYSFLQGSNINALYRLINLSYKTIEQDVFLGTTDITIPISQQIDREYENN